MEIFDGTNYRPPKARITGPSFIEAPKIGAVIKPDLRDVAGQNFIAVIDSLISGPRAKVTVYAGDNFSGERTTFDPNVSAPDLKQLGFSNRIRSMKIACE